MVIVGLLLAGCEIVFPLHTPPFEAGPADAQPPDSFGSCFVDDFTGPNIDSSRWTIADTGSPVRIVQDSGALVVQFPTDDGGANELASKLRFDLTERSLEVVVASVPDGGRDLLFGMRASADATHYYSMGLSQTTTNVSIVVQQTTPGSSVVTAFAFDPVRDKFWRITNSGTSVAYETSSDGATFSLLKLTSAEVPFGGLNLVLEGSVVASPDASSEGRFDRVRVTGGSCTN